MIGCNMTSCIGCALVAKSPGCRAADYSARAKALLANIEFHRAIKPSTSWEFCTHPPPSYHPAKEVRFG